MNIVPLFECLLYVSSFRLFFKGFPCFELWKKLPNWYVRHVMASLSRLSMFFVACSTFFCLKETLVIIRGGRKMTRKMTENNWQQELIAEKLKNKFSRAFCFCFLSDRPSVTPNCANFHSFFLTCSVQNYSNDLNFHQIYLSREQEEKRWFSFMAIAKLKIFLTFPQPQ